MTPRSLRMLAPLLLLPALTRAEPGTFALDPVHTRVLFRVDHAGLSSALGTFSGATGTLRFDPADWSDASLEVSLPLASLELGDAEWRRRVLGRGFLDAAGTPVARFASTRVEPTGEGTARVHGELSLRGVVRPVVLEVRLNALKRHPMTFRRTAGFSATATLSRTDFGMDGWPNVVGDRVELWIEAEAMRTRADPGQNADAARDENPDDDADPQSP